jgi:hypothetical protein
MQVTSLNREASPKPSGRQVTPLLEPAAESYAALGDTADGSIVR